MSQIDLTVETVPVTKLTFDPNNARKHNRKNLDAIKASLKEFGQRRPLVVTTEYVVVAGNGTLEAAKSLGWEEIAVTVLPFDDPEKAKAYALADNRTAELAEWDMEILTATVDELEQAGWDMDSLGFGELRPTDEPEVVQDEVPDLLPEPITKEGDLWILGEHRLLCGDSTDAADFERLMDGKLADCIWTDPPYNVAYVGGTKDALTIQNDAMSDEDFEAFLGKAYERMFESAHPGAAIYVAHSDTGGGVFRRQLVEAGFLLKQCLIWVKDTFVLSRQDYHWQHEPILYGWKAGAAHNWYGPRTRATVLEDGTDITALKKSDLVQILQEIADGSSVIREDKPRRNGEHPTMKPVKLVARMLQNSTKRGDIVLDPFGGSGSTLIASAQMDRTCFTMEKDPRYCDVIVKRWEALTQGKAQRGEG
jgi:DNA modification methylase